MGKKKKNKIRILSPEDMDEDPFIELENNSKEIFEEHIEQTNWKDVADHIKKKDQQIKAKKPKKNKELSKVVDLHGYTVSEAQEKIDSIINEMLESEANLLHLTVITGKGSHSGERGAVLAEKIPLHLQKKWAKRIIYMEESPAKLVIHEKLIRGHFNVTLNVR